MVHWYTRIMMMIAGMLFIIGIVLILSATSMGKKKGTQAIWANGGSMETGTYNWIMQTSVQNYRTAGTIISLVGGCGLILCGTAVYWEMKSEQ